MNPGRSAAVAMAVSFPPQRASEAVRRRVEEAAGRALEAVLADEGFAREGAQLVRRARGVVEVVEVQHSIYGGRVTANLGLDLVFLRPLVRWVPRPSLGPHAHDCVRWLRVGLAGEQRGDRWWTYEAEDPASIAAAAASLAEEVAGPGRGWLVRERTPAAFLAHAERAVERSRSRAQPDGGYLELRLLAAVHAWRGDFERGREVCRVAGCSWEGERARLVPARTIYRRRHPAAAARLPPVPPLQRELERLTEPTTGARILRRAGVEPPPRRSSRSGSR